MAETKVTINGETDAGGAWTAFTPSWANLTPGSGTNTGYYKQIGKTVFFRVYFKYGSGSSVGSAPALTLPVTSVNYVDGYTSIGQGTAWDNGGSIFDLYVSWASTTSCILLAKVASSTYVSHASVSSTVPLNFGTNDTITIQGFYEAA